MNEFVFGKSLNKIIHGGDYNPEQWLDRPDVLQMAIAIDMEEGIITACRQKNTGKK